MKKVIFDSLKSYKWKILIQLTLIALNIYLLTVPAKIIGNIVDLLYDIPNNKQEILYNTYYLIGICLFLLVIRVTWKYFETYTARGFEKDIKNKLLDGNIEIKNLTFNYPGYLTPVLENVNLKIDKGQTVGYYSKLYQAYYSILTE